MVLRLGNGVGLRNGGDELYAKTRLTTENGAIGKGLGDAGFALDGDAVFLVIGNNGAVSLFAIPGLSITRFEVELPFAAIAGGEGELLGAELDGALTIAVGDFVVMVGVVGVKPNPAI